jgi:hypothetical protein
MRAMIGLIALDQFTIRRVTFCLMTTAKPSESYTILGISQVIALWTGVCGV